MRFVFSKQRGCWVDPAEAWAERAAPARSGLPAPMLIRDGLDYVLNHADGERYTSKRAYEKAVKAAGCEIVGNDPSFRQPKRPEYKSEGLVEDIKRAIETTAA